MRLLRGSKKSVLMVKNWKREMGLGQAKQGEQWVKATAHVDSTYESELANEDVLEDDWNDGKINMGTRRVRVFGG